jgi:hypothetical protein
MSQAVDPLVEGEAPEMADLDKLPEGIALPELIPFVERVLAARSCEADAQSQALAECADKLWHTYEKLPSDLRFKIVERCRDLWVECNERVKGNIIFVASTLRLTELAPELEFSVRDEILGHDLRENINEALLLLRVDPDPYSSLRGLAVRRSG